jgi:hypothetical protein
MQENLIVLSANEFMEILNACLSPLVDSERTVMARFSTTKGFTNRPSQSSVLVNFYNLPENRVKEGRGGGAEATNNRMLFSIHGFDEAADVPVAKVRVEQLITLGRGMKILRTKNGSPDKIALYLAKYINEIAEAVAPNFTHE